MKNRSKFYALGMAAVVLFMSSCSIVNSEFSKRKYTKFKVRHEHADLAKTDVTNVPVTATENEPIVVNVNEETRSASLNAPVSEVKRSGTKNVSTVPSLKKESKDVKSSGFGLTKTFVKQYSKLHKAKHSSKPNTNEVLLIILCLLLPPVAVIVERGVGFEFWVDLILTFLFFIPGVIYAFIVCFGGGGGGRSATR